MKSRLIEVNKYKKGMEVIINPWTMRVNLQI